MVFDYLIIIDSIYELINLLNRMTLIGAMMIFMGLLGLVMAMRDEREEGWSQSRLKFSLSVISLLIVGFGFSY
jgi:hypothetical protein